MEETIEEIKFDAFADEIFAKEDTKKEISAEIKEAIEAFAEKHNLNKKSVASTLKKIKEFRKNAQEFYVVDQEEANLLNSTVYKGLN